MMILKEKRQIMLEVGDIMEKFFYIIISAFMFSLILLLTSCCFVEKNDNKKVDNSSDQNITITEDIPQMNKIKVEDILYIFDGMYDPELKAEAFIDTLNSIGIINPSTINISNSDEKVIVVEVLENDIKYSVTLSAKTGYVGVIYKDGLDGDAIYYHTDD